MAKKSNQRPVFQAKKLGKIYDNGVVRVEALRNINLTIYSGEFVVLLGRSGSGKSTLMNILGLLDRPTSGELRLAKEDASKLSPQRAAKLRNEKIGFVFQTFNLLPRMSALENVELPLIYGGINREKRLAKAKEKLIQVGLEERMDHLPSQLSGGQQQRVAVARALANEPDIILADEPTGNLDSHSGREILDLITKVNKQGRTVFLITHDPKIADYSTRALTLEDGQLITDNKNG